LALLVKDVVYVTSKPEAVVPPPTTSGQRPFFVFAERQAREIEWLHPGLIPLGKVTLLIGDPGNGKSQLAVDPAMRVTRGWEILPAVNWRGRDDQPRLYSNTRRMIPGQSHA
jgi:hypothetical protein